MTDPKLAEWEALVLAQTPASEPWTPVTDYSREAREAIEAPHADRIIEAFRSPIHPPPKVIDVGCGPGHLVRLLHERGLEARGFDKATGFDIAYERDVLLFVEPAELVICREVLEHLTVREIARAVRNLCALSSRFVYVTTRFHLAPTHLLDLATSDDLDPTHISLTNQTWLRHLFVLEGFKRRADLETILDWQHKGRVLVYERT